MNQHSGTTALAQPAVLDEFTELAVRAAHELHEHGRGQDGLCPIDGAAFPCARACRAANNLDLVAVR